jgi:DNA-binding transcriptional LysR family regulator
MNRHPATWQWDDVRFFLAVARTGTLSSAARTLRVGHVTVGRRIALLEKRLGVVLLSRMPDGFSTTPAGQAILQQCAAMESAALDLERIAAGRDSRVSGTVRLTTTEALAHQLVVPAISALRHAHPDLQIDLTVGVRLLDIARRDADVAIRLARPATPELVCRKLGEVGSSLYASQRYLAKHGPPKRGQGLGNFDVITYTGAPAAARPFFMGESLEGARVAVRCDSPLVQMRAAADHLGIAELACFLGDAGADVVRIWPDEPPALRTAWLVVHQDLRRSARIKVVASAITEAFHRQFATLRSGHTAKRSAAAALARK